jgi:hypothetical protein
MAMRLMPEINEENYFVNELKRQRGSQRMHIVHWRKLAPWPRLRMHSTFSTKSLRPNWNQQSCFRSSSISPAGLGRNLSPFPAAGDSVSPKI